MRRIALTVIACLVAGPWSGAAAAGELAVFNGAVAGIYGHYRQAVFYTRTGSPAVAALELDEFVAGWSDIVERFGTSPPDPFSDDPSWSATLSEIGSRATAGLAALDRGDLAAAGESLGPIRGLLGDLRRRNGIVTFSDYVDELSAAMDVLAEYRRDLDDLSDDAVVAAVARQAAVVEYLFDKVRLNAPAALADDAEFQRMLEGVRQSMGRLREGLRNRDIRLFRIGSGELRSHERLLFLRYG